MSSCDGSSINKNYIVLPPTDVDVLSACTGFYTNNIYNCTGDTLTLHSATVSANTINASVYLSGGTNLLDIFGSFDNYTTGATLVGSTAYFDRTDLLSAYTLNLSTLVDNNTFVTGYTYDDSNTFTISDNNGSTFNATFNTVTGLTVNGGLSATTVSACTGIYTSNLYGCSPITVNDSLILLSGLTFSSITEDNTLTQILGRNSTTGDIEYRDVQSIISAATSQDTFVTAFTYDNINTFTISDNSGNTFNSTIDILSATTISATTYYGDGSNLSGISTDNFYVSGGTYDTVSKNVNFSGNSIETTFSVDLTSLVSSVSGDTFVNGGNANVTTSELTFSNNTGGTFTVTNSAALFSDNDINVTGGTYNPSNGCVTFVTNSGTTFDVCGFVTGITDTFVTGGTYNDSTDIITFTNTSGNTFNVTGITDSYTTGSTINGTTIQFDNNLLGLNYYNVDLLPLLSGKTNNTTFNTYTSDTQTIINTKISGATNLNGTGLFAQKNGENLEFKGITSTGGTVTITNDSDSVNIEIPIDTNTFVTGFTYDNSNNLTISRNDGSGFTTNIGTMTGLTVNGGLSATTVSACTGIYTSNLYGCSPITVHDNIQSITSSATGATSFAFGKNVNAFGNYSHAEGYSTTASGYGSHAEGSATIASGYGSHAEGSSTIASGRYSHSEGYGTTASGDYGSHAEGNYTTASGNYGSHAEGNATIASGYGSHAEGNYTTASGEYSHAEGYYTTASGNYGSHAGGKGVNTTNNITASGETSFAHFRQTSASGNIGAYGDYSAILGGNDHNIGTGSVSSGIFAGSGNVINDNVLRSVVLGGQNITGVTNDTVYVPTLNLTTTLSNDNSQTQVLVRNNTTGVVEYRDASTFSGTPDTNTFVSGGTYSDSTDIITFTNTTGGTFNVTGVTDTFVTGGTYSSGTTSLDFSGNTGFAPFSVNVSELIDDTNTFVTGFTYNDANTFTISDNNGSTFDASINTMTGLTVNGQSTFSGSSTDVVTIIGSGSTSPLFRVEGSSGELFTITDSLIGELFAVNNISGLPILTVNSDNTILWGDNTVPSLNTTVKKSINSGLTEIYTIPVSAYTGGFFDYTVTGAGARAGSITSIFSGTSVQFNETTTNDIGDTSGITFDMNISGGTANLTVSATTNSWEIRTIVRSI
jgi:hypothetical protein